VQIQRILVPVDGSQLTERAIAASVGLARQLGASIIGFVAVLRRPPLTGSADSWVDTQGTNADEITAGDAEKVLARFADAAGAAGVPFEGVAEPVARIDKAIIAAAESRGCDLVVMVTHGRGAFGEFLYGSQTKAVLSGSTLPLLVLH
jgi:nucleotide-binding universal stress UspA family protein